MKQKINRITMCSAYIVAKRINDDGTENGSSIMSGCLWLDKDNSYVITNWHNVTGINPNTDENIGRFCPNRLFVTFKYHMPTEQKGINNVVEGTREIKLYNDQLEKQWLEHPYGKKVDVVAIPVNLELEKGAIVNYINKQEKFQDWLPEIGDDCFIIGYPEGILGPLRTPIWKRGSVATLPLLDYNDQPVFLLDTIGNQGLSGSAVIGRGNGIFDKNNSGKLSGNTIIGSWENFVGIYAGRISKSGIGSQLGRVWKRTVIDEIFKHNNM